MWAHINLMREFGHATGHGGVFSHSQFYALTSLWFKDTPTVRVWRSGMIAAFYALIECMKTIRKQREDETGNKSANHLPWVRRCRKRSWLHVVLIVTLFLHTHGPDLQSNLILLNTTPCMPQWVVMARDYYISCLPLWMQGKVIPLHAE